METRPSYAVKPAGYALVCCHKCGAKQRVEIGEDPEGWIKVSTVRGQRARLLCPDCGDRYVWQ